MDPAQTSAGFQTTMWSMVMRAQQDREHLERLLRLYWSPIYGFIRRQGYTRPDASDLTQEFMTRVVLKRDLLTRADPERGRFRSFLKSALRNFLIDEHRAGRFSKSPRGAGSQASSRREGEAGQGQTDPSTAERVAQEFDRQWAGALVEQTLRALEDDSSRDGMSDHWRIFNAQVIAPALRKARPLPLAELTKQMPSYTEDQLSNMIQTMKRRFRRTLHQVVRETVADEREVEQEIADLRAYLGGRGRSGGGAA